MRFITKTASALALATVPAQTAGAPLNNKPQQSATPYSYPTVVTVRAIESSKRDAIQFRNSNSTLPLAVTNNVNIGAKSTADGSVKQPAFITVQRTPRQAQVSCQTAARASSTGTNEVAVTLGTKCECGVDCWIVKRDNTTSPGPPPENKAQKGIDTTVLVAAGLATSLVGACILYACSACGVFKCCKPRRRPGRSGQATRPVVELEMGRR